MGVIRRMVFVDIIVLTHLGVVVCCVDKNECDMKEGFCEQHYSNAFSSWVVVCFVDINECDIKEDIYEQHCGCVLSRYKRM